MAMALSVSLVRLSSAPRRVIQGQQWIRCVSGWRAQADWADVDPGPFAVVKEYVPPVRVRKVDDQGRAYGTGKRKTAIARVWVKEGSGQFIVNNKPLHDYIRSYVRLDVLRPFLVTSTAGLIDVYSTVKGGGISSQAGALRLGVSRALQCFDPAYRIPLKRAGFLTRDSRKVERKKPGQKKARKKFAWVKR